MDVNEALARHGVLYSCGGGWNPARDANRLIGRGTAANAKREDLYVRVAQRGIDVADLREAESRRLPCATRGTSAKGLLTGTRSAV